MIDNCSACKSTDITKGTLTNGATSRAYPLVFKPDCLDFLTMTLTGGTPVAVYACRSCGHIWPAVDPDVLRTFMEKYCEKE